ncbi:MAG: hypothetical protein KTR22_14955 [Flavobacteriaceae bacterium]|nr:hypothetical protein [Flavobacteriaceae bacterium]
MKYSFYLIILTANLVSCQTNFDREVWLEPKNNEVVTRPNPRYLMVHDLMDNHLEIGQTKEEVLEFLGIPSEDGFRKRIIEGRIPPDSLEIDRILEMEQPNKERLFQQLLKWNDENSEHVKMVSYYVGWTLADAVSLDIFLNDSDEVTGFELHQH